MNVTKLTQILLPQGRVLNSILLQHTPKLKQKIWLRGITTKAIPSVRTLDVTFAGESTQHSYPFIWLRDNCQCDKCYGKTTFHRHLLVKQLDVEIKPKSVKVDTNKNIVITWPDDHLSEFCPDWLLNRGFTDNGKQKLGPPLEKTIKSWGKELQNNIPEVKYNELMSSDKALYQWMVTLEELGIYLITGAPTVPGVLVEIGKRVAYLRRTHYGEIFIVKSKENPSNAAYTGGPLGLHTDLSYYNYTPGMQMLHCISQVPSEGGGNEYADGFYVTKIMKEEYPDLYQVLLGTPQRFIDVGTDHFDFHQVSQSPFIEENEKGDVIKLNSNNHSRSSFTGLTSDGIIKFYQALTTFETLMNQRGLITHKMNNGEIMCFHNYRVFHGREGYRTEGTGQRHLEGGYIDWDEMHSKRRVLEDKFGLN